MKIAIEGTTIGPRITGTNRFLNCLIEQLEYLDNELLYFTPPIGSISGRLVPGSIIRHYYRLFSLKKEIVKSDADCGIFPDYFMPLNFIKPAAVVIHDLSFITHPEFYSAKFVKYYTYQIKKTLEQNPLVLAVSRHTKNNIINYLNVKEENIHIVQGYSGMKKNVSKYHPASKNNIPYLLYVGHIEPRKNLNFLIEGFQEWKKGSGVNINLKIVGELWIKSRGIIELMTKYRNDPDIEFMGYVTDEQLETLYMSASGFLHTSFEEGFGFPVLEAMNFNLPVICTQGIATAEISSPLSIPINPGDKLSYYNGLEIMYSFIINNEKPVYDIKYSPQLMREQLSVVMERLDSRVRKHSGSGIPKASEDEEALIKTLVYSGMFNSGIKSDKIHEQLFDRKIKKEVLITIIERYKAANIIREINGYLQLNYSINNYYKIHRGMIDKKKINRIIGLLNKLPFISLIAFSGGTTHYGIENHDDIDLFIISKPYSVYIVYLLIHFFSIILNVRKELCANFLIDESNLELGQNYDFYTAHQIITLNGFRNSEMLSHFYSRNRWIKSFYPNFRIMQKDYKSSGMQYILLRPVNLIIMSLYKLKYKKLISKPDLNKSLILSEKCLKLHTNDNRREIINKFQQVWKKYKQNNFNSIKEERYLVLK
jgi:glycosyltransferase involved in cell wall biosynthesis